MKKIFTNILWFLQRCFYMVLLYLMFYFIVISIFFIFMSVLEPKSIKEVQNGKIIYNLRKSRINCKNNCYAIWDCESYEGGCSSRNSGSFLEKMNKVYDIYVEDGILHIVIPKEHYSIKDKLYNYDNRIESYKLLNTENIDGNIIEKYEIIRKGEIAIFDETYKSYIIGKNKYNINFVYR